MWGGGVSYGAVNHKTGFIMPHSLSCPSLPHLHMVNPAIPTNLAKPQWEARWDKKQGLRHNKVSCQQGNSCLPSSLLSTIIPCMTQECRTENIAPWFLCTINLSG